MKCDKCGAWSEVLDTREMASQGVTRRRRECGNGHVFTTYEIFSQAWPAARHRSREKAQSRERSGPLWERNQKILRLLAHGASQAEAARIMGTTRHVVDHVKRKEQDERMDRS